MERLTRRTALRLGAGLAGACALDPLWQLGLATAKGTPPGEQPTPSSAKTESTHVTGSFVSAARGGVENKWAVALPPGRYAQPLHTVIALHGRDMDADGVMGMGVEAGLAELARAGYPPFAVAAVDGGNGWWHRRVTGEDSGAMVLNEFLPLMASKGLDTGRVSFIGWSMGGYGALLLGGALGPKRTAAICAVAPALFTDYGFHNTGTGVLRRRGGDGPVSIALAPDLIINLARDVVRSVAEPDRTDDGRLEVTGRPEDLHRFKTPSLRNVALTAPYMHDGSLTSLDQVVRHYDRGGTGAPGQDPRIRPLNLSEREMRDLVTFLHSLTGDNVNALVRAARG